MAQGYVDPIGGELTIPGAYPSITVAPANGGLATTGVIVLMGEADAGPAFDEESELGDNLFAADDIQSLIAKYKSGPVVDAARAAAGAAIDPDITNTFSRLLVLKTNKGTKASSAVTVNNLGVSEAYDSLVAKAGGSLGNLIFYTVADAVAAVPPTTGNFTYIPQPGALQVEIRYDGSIATVVNIIADRDPANAAADLGGSGGGARAGVVPNPGVDTLAIAIVSPGICTFTLSSDWVGVAVGDTFEIPVGSSFVGAGSANVGWYVVTDVDGGVITATKLSDKLATPGHVAGNRVAPVAVGAAATANPYTTDLQVYRPVVLAWADGPGNDYPGVSYSLEIAGTSAAVGDTNVANAFRQLGSTATVTWHSTAAAPYAIVGTERQAQLNVERKNDNVSEEYIFGGEVGLKVGYDGYSCTLNVDSTSVTVAYQLTNVSPVVTVVLGFDQYPTISDLAAYLNTLANFSAAPGTAVLGNLPTSALDHSTWGTITPFTYGCATTNGAMTGRVKIDAFRAREALVGSYLVEFEGTPLGGLPENVASTYLAGGTKGATTTTRIADSITAMEQVTTNFVVPCFSRDATDDIADGLTDVSSTYQIDAINDGVKAHVHKMSGMKVKRNRQAFLSKKGTFDAVSEASANIASHRCMMTFQDVKNSSSGAIVQYQPYVAAALAAAMQAGAFYKSIVRKQVSVTAALQAAGDWTYNRDSNLENALKAGLNPIRKAEEGGFVWVSDQTTYGKDTKNFYNSIQMVYAGDIVALTTAQRMERAFVGQSVADVSAPLALSFLDSIMADFLRLKLIAPSSDAPLGYRNARVVIEGAVMRVSVEVKIAGSIYFIPISFYVTEITQVA